ncbi:hypothetical protein GCM10023187_21400 [Nibrella viscosa]|uniref:O-Antigen ligase n=1 Tax=Nibrella viscosa TaxID=1084524 RepID=A0ABP8KCW6_9BACT
MIGRLIYRLDLMRMCLGIFLLIDGFPLIFYIKEFLRVAPGSTTFTAIFILVGLIIMIPISMFRKLYKPNVTLFWFLLAFLVWCMAYMFFYNRGDNERTKDLIYYSYVIAFLIILVNVPNTVNREIVIVGALFALVSNLALIHALIADPTWTIGQRAAILYGEGDNRTGNPHVFSRNAQIGMVCSLIWAYRSNAGIFVRSFGLILAFFNLIILVLTFSKGAILSTLIALGLFAAANFNAKTMRNMGRQLVSPTGIAIMLIPFIAFQYFIYKRPDIWGIILSYGFAIYDRFSENILALLADRSANAGPVELDASSANRVVSFHFANLALEGHAHRLIFGFGYKFQYMDVPVLETLICLGIFGFLLYSTMLVKFMIHAVRIIFKGGIEIELFIAFLYIFVFVNYFTGGRPYEMANLLPLCLFVRFLGIYYPDYVPSFLSSARKLPAVPG